MIIKINVLRNVENQNIDKLYYKRLIRINDPNIYQLKILNQGSSAWKTNIFSCSNKYINIYMCIKVIKLILNYLVII